MDSLVGGILTELSNSEGNLPGPRESTDIPASIIAEIGPAEMIPSLDANSESGIGTSDNGVPMDAPRNKTVAVAEAFGWWFGALLVHFVAGAGMAVALIVFNLISKKPKPADVMNPESMMSITAGEMILFAIAAMLAVSVRYWGRTFSELNFSRPDSRHVWMVIGGTLPLSMCVSACSVPIQMGWTYLGEIIPTLKFFDNMNTMELVKDIAATSSLTSMIFVIAVLPAIGEELIFRGAVGRVLIANLGLTGGVLLTSFLFGWLHIHPVHALAVIPLGLAIHLVYLWSRSFWLPMLLHFLNNSWVLVTAQGPAIDPVRQGASMQWTDGLLMGVSVIAVIALGLSFWQSRVRFFDSEDCEWEEPRFPVRARPGLHRKSSPMNSTYWTTSVISIVLCHLIVLFELLQS